MQFMQAVPEGKGRRFNSMILVQIEMHERDL